MSKINDLNGRAWTGVTEVFQDHSEDLQEARRTVQNQYDAAQGNNGAARNSATLAQIESKLAQRMNYQQGMHIDPSV